MGLEQKEISGRTVWDGSKPAPLHGSAEVPAQTIHIDLRGGRNEYGLDIGCGTGRSTKTLVETLNTEFVVAFDLSHIGLLAVDATSRKVEGNATKLPFKNESFDWVNLSGLMTNITDRDPKKAQHMRKMVIKEAARVLRPKGVLLISDFLRTHYFSNHYDNYHQHKLITGEYGTLAIFDSEEHSPFNKPRTDEEITTYRDSKHLVRFARHYTPYELRRLVEDAGLWIDLLAIQRGVRPSGRPIDQVIIPGIKGEEPPELNYDPEFLKTLFDQFITKY